MVQSIFSVFGSAFRDPSTGILFNNRMQGFTNQVSLSEQRGAGKRPAQYAVPGSGTADETGEVCSGEPGRHQPNAHERAGDQPIARRRFGYSDRRRSPAPVHDA